MYEFPDNVDALADVEPVYETFAGWSGTCSGARRFGDLPAPAQTYLRRVAELTGVPLALVSVGRERTNTLTLQPMF